MINANIVKDTDGKYVISTPLTKNELLTLARDVAAQDLEGELLNSPDKVRDALNGLGLVADREVFGVLWLNSAHRVMRHETLFTGTLASCMVYPREVIKSALAVNAAACIVYHNHPSGNMLPSAADDVTTDNLKKALDVVQVKLLDHFILTPTGPKYSYAERGRII